MKMQLTNNYRYNGTIFAYGQTGSGKTHSIMGYDSDPGIIPRVTTSFNC